MCRCCWNWPGRQAHCSRHTPCAVRILRQQRSVPAQRLRNPPCGARSAWALPATRHSTSIIPTTWNRWPSSGAEWVAFSPLADARLPADLDGLYFGGGYPEVHAARLAANAADAGRRARALPPRAGRVYAECGGLMYLGRALDRRSTARATRWPACCPSRPPCSKSSDVLGYAEVDLGRPIRCGARPARWLPRPRVPLLRDHRRPRPGARAGSRPTPSGAAARARRGRRLRQRARPGRLRAFALGFPAGGDRHFLSRCRGTS